MHDKNKSTITERGQVSIPAEIRKLMGLKPGHSLKWIQVSAKEIKVILEEQPTPIGALAVLGYARKINPNISNTTAEVMAELREGEED